MGDMETITVNVNGDFKVEADETFTVSLGTPSNVGVGASPQAWTISNDEKDFGDAPDTCGTSLAANGARHNASPALRLGAMSDGEADGQPTSDATGDGADDDGVIKLDAWVDFDGNGSFGDPGEKVFDNMAGRCRRTSPFN